MGEVLFIVDGSRCYDPDKSGYGQIEKQAQLGMPHSGIQVELD